MVDGNVGEWKSTAERRSHCEMSMNDTFGFDFSWGSYRDNLSKSYDLVVFFFEILNVHDDFESSQIMC